MVLGWRDFFMTKVLRQRHEFVSVDARNFSTDARTYEMLDSAKATTALNITSPDRVLSPGQAHPLRSSPMTPEPDMKEDSYFNSKNMMQMHDSLSPQTPAPAYRSPSPTPSTPRMGSPRVWDLQATGPTTSRSLGIAISKDYT